MTMSDLTELVLQNYLARHNVQEPTTNGHTKTGLRKQVPILCGNCGEGFKKVRYRVRIEQQTKGRKWGQSGLEIIYLCPGCHILQTSLMLGGF